MKINEEELVLVRVQVLPSDWLLVLCLQVEATDDMSEQLDPDDAGETFLPATSFRDKRHKW